MLMNILLATMVFLCLAILSSWYSAWPRKNLTPDKPTTVLITGGVQGLGKLLAQQFGENCAPGSVKLLVCDIREDLKAEFFEEFRKSAPRFIREDVIFYKGNLAEAD